MKVTYTQPNFLGGEWSKFYQGRADNQKYRTAMNLSYNGFPVEAGPWVRRPGFRLCAPTFKGQEGKLYPLYFKNNQPYTVEFTDGNIRFFNETFPVITEEVTFVAAISSDNPAQVTLTAPVSWATDDEVAFYVSPLAPGNSILPLRQRTFLITVLADSFSAYDAGTTYGNGSLVVSDSVVYVSIQGANVGHTPASSPLWWKALGAEGSVSRKFSLRDAITNEDIDGSTIGNVPPADLCVCLRGLRLATPYTDGSWAAARIVQNQDVAVIVNGLNIPQVLQITPNTGSNQAASASIKDMIFRDGPYLDPIVNSQASVSGLSGTVEVTVNFITWDDTKTYAVGDFVSAGSNAYRSKTDGNLNNDPTTDDGTNWETFDPGVAVTGPDNPLITGFQQSDVGRLMRFFSQPDDWNGGNYTAGDEVWYNGLAYKAVADNSAVQPDSDPTIWAIDPTGYRWTWGKITSVVNSNTVEVLICGNPLLYSNTIKLWRLGVYSDTSGWPTCGLFYGGRFYLGGVVENRFDATAVADELGNPGYTKDGVLLFSPTLEDGTVTDSSGISYELTAKDKNSILWMEVDQRGIIMGTAGGEWLVSPSAGEIITPTSINAVRVTRYKCANIEPKRAPIALIFVQAFKRKIMEFLQDVFTSRFTAPHLTEAAKHLTTDDVEEIYYQEELVPILWARTGAGKLIGATYRRTSMMASEAPQFTGWHQHEHGMGRLLESIAVGPNADGTLESLSAITNNTDDDVRWVEQMTMLFDEDDSIYDAFFLDGAIIPDFMYEDTVDNVTGMRFTGLWYLKGKTVDAFVAGLDVGQFTVDENGTIFVPYGSGVDPKTYNYSEPGGGAWKFTHDFVEEVLALNLTLRNGGIQTSGSTQITSTPIDTNPNITSKIFPFTGDTYLADGSVPDWYSGRMVTMQTDKAGFTVFGLSDSSIIAQATISTITSAAFTSTWGWTTCDRDGNLYFGVGSSNYGPWYKVKEEDLSVVFSAGANDNFDNIKSANSWEGGAIPTATKANATWIFTLSQAGTLGAFNKRLMMYKGVDPGTFIAGNDESDPAYQGVTQKPWIVDERNVYGLSAGAPTYQNNVASVYAVAASLSSGSDNPQTVALYFLGLADGVPTGGGNAENDGSTGKKGKGKKDAADGGVIHIPTVDDPLAYFDKIGTFTATDVDSRWVGITAVSAPIVDQMDNSVIVWVKHDLTTLSAYDAGTTYNTGDIVSSSGQAYVSNIDNNTGNTPSSNFDRDDNVDVSKPWRRLPLVYITAWTTGQFSRTNTGTYGLKWKVPYIDFFPSSTLLMSKSRVLGGLYGIISPIYSSNKTHVWLIDTATGKYFVGDMPGVDMQNSPNSGDQSWDDQSQSFITTGGYHSSVSGAPTRIVGSGDFAPVSGWDYFRLYVGNLVQSADIPSTLDLQPNGYNVITTDVDGGNFPAVIGQSYESKGQTLRAIAPDEAGARNGPALGKVRRPEKTAFLLHNTLGIEFGAEFDYMNAPRLKDPQSNIPLGPSDLFSDIWRDSLEAKYDFDGMIAWRIKRPYPATIVSLQAWNETQDG